MGEKLGQAPLVSARELAGLVPFERGPLRNTDVCRRARFLLDCWSLGLSLGGADMLIARLAIFGVHLGF